MSVFIVGAHGSLSQNRKKRPCDGGLAFIATVGRCSCSFAGGQLDKVPFGAAFAKGLTFRMGQTHVHRYPHPLLERIERGEIDPSFVITHCLNLNEVLEGYEIFKHKEDDCIKVVLKP